MNCSRFTRPLAAPVVDVFLLVAGLAFVVMAEVERPLIRLALPSTGPGDRRGNPPCVVVRIVDRDPARPYVALGGRSRRMSSGVPGTVSIGPGHCRGTRFSEAELREWLYPIARSCVDPKTKRSDIAVEILAPADLPFDSVRRLFEVMQHPDLEMYRFLLYVDRASSSDHG